VVLMDVPAPGIDEQIVAVASARDHLVRSAQWRAGRRSFDKIRHAREVASLDAAIVTLTQERARLYEVFRRHTLLGPMK
jgi:hypothetical protein